MGIQGKLEKCGDFPAIHKGGVERGEVGQWREMGLFLAPVVSSLDLIRCLENLILTSPSLDQEIS